MIRRVPLIHLPYLAVIFLVVISASPAFSVDQPVSVPLHVFRSGHIGVQVRINGKGPFRLVLDTGSPVTFISSRVGRQLGLSSSSDGGASASIFGLGMGMNPFASAKSLDVGGAVVKDLAIMVLDHPVLEMLGAVEGPVDGIVGFTFFSRFRTTLDYSAKRAIFTPTAYEPPDVLKNVMGILMGREGSRRIVAPAALWGMVVEEGKDGPTVQSVLGGGPASEAGVLPGDHITALDSRWVTSVLGLYEQTGGIRAGAEATLTVVRDGRKLSVTVKPRLGI